jgi:hypothetical protein
LDPIHVVYSMANGDQKNIELWNTEKNQLRLKQYS